MFDKKITTGKYDDIIDLPRPKFRHPKMSRKNRAAQFAPFAALRGQKEEIQELQRIVEQKKVLTDVQKEEIDRSLQHLLKIQNLYPEVNVTYFVPDYRKHGGFYETYIGRLERIDTKKKLLVFCNEKEIEFGLLCDLTVTEQENQNEGI